MSARNKYSHATTVNRFYMSHSIVVTTGKDQLREEPLKEHGGKKTVERIDTIVREHKGFNGAYQRKDMTSMTNIGANTFACAREGRQGICVRSWA